MLRHFIQVMQGSASREVVHFDRLPPLMDSQLSLRAGLGSDGRCNFRIAALGCRVPPCCRAEGDSDDGWRGEGLEEWDDSSILSPV